MKILVTESIDQSGLELLSKVGEVIYGTGTDEETILREGADADAILVRVAKITSKIIHGLPNLKVVAKHGIGVDNIDVSCCTRNDVMVVNAPKSNANAVAEHTIALILSISKNLVLLDKATRNGEFSMRNFYPTDELDSKTLGLIGMGNIASLIAKKMSAFGMKIIAYDPLVSQSEFAIMVLTPEEVYLNADVISIHIPLFEETKHFISYDAFNLMKIDAYLINASRGGVVDECALLLALKEKKIRGAAIDVFEEEPPKNDNPLFELDNVIVSPHNAALSREALVNMAVHAAKGICDRLNGKEPEWVVNKELLSKCREVI